MTKSHIAKRSLFHLVQKLMGTSLENIQITRKDGQDLLAAQWSQMQIKLQFEALKLFMTGENYAQLPNEAHKTGTCPREKHDIRGGTIYKKRLDSSNQHFGVNLH